MVVIVRVQCSLDPTDIENREQKSAETQTRLVNGPLSGTTRVSRYQKGKTNLDFTTARDSEWQWHQLCHMQVCTSLLPKIIINDTVTLFL